MATHTAHRRPTPAQHEGHRLLESGGRLRRGAEVEESVAATDLTSLTCDAERLLRAEYALAAERVCSAILSFAPEQPLALLLLSLALQARGCHAEAEAALVRGVSAHPRLAAFHAALGRLQLELNRPQEALPSFENCRSRCCSRECMTDGSVAPPKSPQSIRGGSVSVGNWRQPRLFPGIGLRAARV
jgi:hypothetical protein